jgi:hypothetical protein
MHAKVIAQRAAALERVIDALAEELIESTDDELLQAAADLGMDVTMRGSAAFVGLKYPMVWQFADFFAVPARQGGRVSTDRGPKALASSRNRRGGPKKRSD